MANTNGEMGTTINPHTTEAKVYVRKWTNQSAKRYTVTIDFLSTPDLLTTILDEIAERERLLVSLSKQQRAALLWLCAELMMMQTEAKPLDQPTG